MGKSRKHTKQSNFRLLPQDVMIEILLRLSFESILACKRVSKLWRNLINNPKFFNLYRDKSSSMVVFKDKDKLYCGFVIHDQDQPNKYPNPSYEVHELPINLKKFSKIDNGDVLPHQLLYGSFKAIVCVKAANGHFLVFNLFTGSFETTSDGPLRQYSFDHWHCYGFGYDSRAHDYKIFVQNEDNSRFWIYSFRNRSWESFDGFPYHDYEFSYPPVHGGYCFNGVLHWIGEDEEKKVIVTYDFHTREFGEIPVPSNAYGVGVGPSLGRERVTELDGRLCYVYENDNCVWVVEVYGVEESWTKVAVVPYHPSLQRITLDCLGYTALYELEDERKVLLLVCNDNTNPLYLSHYQQEHDEDCPTW